MSLDKNNMKIPKDYFDGLGAKLSTRVDALEDDIENNAPLLYKLGKKEGYKIPSAYFKTFAERQKKYKSKAKLIKMLRPIIGIAATTILLCGWFYMQPNQVESLVQLDDAEMYQYLIENADMLDEDLLADLNDYIIDEEDAADIEYLLDNMSEMDITELENF